LAKRWGNTRKHVEKYGKNLDKQGNIGKTMEKVRIIYGNQYGKEQETNMKNRWTLIASLKVR